MEKSHELLKNIIEAIDAYNAKYNIAVMDETMIQTEEGKEWQKAYWEAKEFLLSQKQN